MKKKMLLVGINDYAGTIQTLQAPEDEIRRWQALLADQYGFTNIRPPLLGAAATKTAILNGFRELIYGAQPDDQLIFTFIGHGNVQRSVSTGRDWWDECVQTYPGDSAGSFINDIDVSLIANEEHVPVGTDLTFIVDCCWGGFLQHRVGARTVSARPEVDYAKVRAFGAFGAYGPAGVARNAFALRRFANDSDVEKPVVVAGCRPHQPAAQLELEGEIRMLFSKRAIEFLTKNPEATFAELISGIRKLHPDIDQEPELRINRSRDNEKFPGEPTDDKAALEFERMRIAALMGTKIPSPAAAARAAGRGRSSKEASTASLFRSLTTADVRVEGIACFADARNASDPFIKRILLPYDSSTNPLKRHIAFLDVPVNQATWRGALPPIIEPHVGGGVLYYRWEFAGHKIAITNVDTSGPLSATTGYLTNVPGMKTGVSGVLNDYPHTTCYASAPDPSIVSAYMDITAGTLSVGPIDPLETQFTNGPLFSWRGHMTTWVNVQVPLVDDGLKIRITPFGSDDDADATEITVAAGGAVRIGTLRDTDITESFSPPELPHEHFPLFYHLAYTDPKPSPLFLPYVLAAPVNGCSPTNWP